MFERCRAIHRSSIAVAGIAATSLALMSLSAEPAEAWYRYHHRHHWPMASHHYRYVRHHVRPGSPRAANIAAIVVDANSGRVLYANNQDEVRHPASITKVMTLYLLFEQLEKGRLHLDSRLRISAHAASQAPTKLGLDEGETIAVEDAIKAVVTKSANDMAVAIAESIGGDEETFAAMMTRKAAALGMASTHYVNASGLPDDEQVTTARDLAILGRAVQERFPRYYHYFQTQVFYFDGVANRNHNHLLGQVEGVDGIKTGYTRSSGFNLLASVKREGHNIVAVVLGGASAGSRDKIMADLIEREIGKGSTVRTAPLVAENNAAPARLETADFRDFAPARSTSDPRPLPEPRPAIETKPTPEPIAKALPEPRPTLETKPTPEPVAKPLPEPRPTLETKLTPEPVGKPLQLIGEHVPPDPVQVAAITEQLPPSRPRPAFVSATPRQGEDQRPEAGDMKRIGLDGSTAHQTTASATPSSLRWVVGPAPARDRTDAAKLAKVETLHVEAAEAAHVDAVAAPDPVRPPAAKSGWMIQVGATDDVGKANDLLARAKAQGRGLLGAAQPFTEKVQKGSETLYRARFAGLAENKAEAACKTLKRSGFACFTTRN
jgi:D-alanyl-D-alanine carboxypeptidase